MYRRTRACGLWLSVFLLLAVCADRAFAVQGTLVADTHVSAAQPAVNSGTLSNVNVGGGYTGLMQFDFSTLPAGITPSQVSRAILILYVNRVDTAGLISLAPLTGGWSEYGVTYATLPGISSSAQLFNVAQAGTYVTVDVTALVQAWLAAPATNFGVALSAGTAVAQFDSKENDLTGHAPVLDIGIVSQGPAGPAGPAGAAGPAGPAGLTGAKGAPGAQGAAGPQGLPGATGAQGPAGPAGPAGGPGTQGPAGATGATGAQGAAGFPYLGVYASTTNYALSDMVLYNGSSYVSLIASNHGNTPDQSPSQWGLIAEGVASGSGPGSTAPALAYEGTYASASNYALNDIVQYNGSSYISLIAANHGNTPGLSPSDWGLLAAAGNGVQGPAGPAGPAGVAGPQGLPGLGYAGAYSSATNYGLDDVVSFQGSSYISLTASNHGNTPGLVASAWAVIAAAGMGSAGATGAPGPVGLTGPQGPVGAMGSAGPQGVAGASGATGAPGLVYQGAYSSTTNYALGDVVLWQGASYASLIAGNHGNTPSLSPQQWGVLTAQGPAGPIGATGMAGPTGATGGTGATGPPGERGDQGLQGIPGQAGAQGIPGTPGAQGLSGPAGAQGPAGPVGVTFQGVYSSVTNYAQGDGVSYNGSSYVSLIASNHGNTPDQSPADWLIFAAGGTPGAPGAPGLVYQGAYSPRTNYAAGDVVFWQGASYASLLAANHGNTPSLSPQQWGVLTAQGATGETGPAGPQGLTGAAGALGPVGPPGATGGQGPQGIAGQAGATGLPGATGPQGLSGPAGPQGAAGQVGLAFQGQYSSVINYALGDGVIFGGSGYVSLVAGNHGNTPDQSPADWALFASGGQNGAQGIPGLSYQGAYASSANYALGDVVYANGASYASLTAANHGNTPALSPAAWGLLAAQGATGLTGPAGVQGPAGATGSQGLTGPAGPQGMTGAQGIAGQAGAQGLTGPAGAPGLSGPQGAQGIAGPAGLNFRGAYASTTNYALADGVSFNGSSYVSLVSGNAGNTPDQSPAQWTLFAQAGAAGPVGAVGPVGSAGPAGSPGPQGVAGSTGPAGAIGPQGPAGLTYRGAYSPATGYLVSDSVTYNGSTYLSLAANNHGNTPDQSPSAWSLLAAQGQTGAMGLAGPAGPAGAAGISGVAGPMGAQGPPVAFKGGWSTSLAYAVGDTVGYAGSSFIAVAANSGREPDVSPLYWSVLASAGSAGPTGPAGPTGLEGPTGYPGPAGPAGATGTTGLTGSTGAMGSIGPAGPSGPQGPAGVAGPAGLVFQGAYSSTVNYSLNDSVSFAGASFISLSANNAGNTPGASSAWALLAAQGAAGPAGAPGVQGTAGAAGLQGPAGSAGPAGAAGAPGLAGPAGAVGPTGAPGPAGANGLNGIAYRGAYDSTANYGANDGVTFGGSSFVSLLNGNTGNTPGASPAAWGLLAAAGAAGAAGPAGQDGTAGPQGPAGSSGAPGAAGAMGAAGANGTPGLVYQGAFNSAANYALNDAVTYNGGSFLSLLTANHGQTPDQSPSAWAVLATPGATGTAGPSGVPGPIGPVGPAGSSGAQGPAGNTGAPGINFRGSWTSGSGYATNDAVTFGGSTYLAQMSNSAVEPDTNAQVWAVLAASGVAGPSGASGTAATISVGTVATGAPGTSASVSNSGTASAAVLNFTIPQGAPGSGGSGSGTSGGGSASGLPALSMYHAVSYAAVYYSVNNTNQASTETQAVETWVPNGCTATALSVFSEQAATITVTLRTGATPASLTNSALSCQAATGQSCTVSGSVIVPAGGFVDLSITHPDSNPVGVWTVLTCN